MTNKISQFGTLAERAARTEANRRARLPRHVLVRDDAGRRTPGLLVAWERAGEGTWWGKVVRVDAAGEPELVLLVADRLELADCSCCAGR